MTPPKHSEQYNELSLAVGKIETLTRAALSLGEELSASAEGKEANLVAFDLGTLLEVCVDHLESVAKTATKYSDAERMADGKGDAS